jgi:cell wall-associated NlpC family hydrolase
MPIARRAGSAAALIAALAFFAVAVIAAMPGAHAWAKGAPGGLSSTTPEYGTEPTAPGSEATTTETPGTALLLGTGRAAAPLNAPPAVKRVIAAANKIRTKPYIWGGGHGRWWDRGYDCSGSVSFALHGGGFLSSPLTSGSLESWGAPGKGRWITIYANAGHVFAVIAGLRWDTVGDTSGTGPRWHPEMVSSRGYVARHPAGY